MSSNFTLYARPFSSALSAAGGEARHPLGGWQPSIPSCDVPTAHAQVLFVVYEELFQGRRVRVQLQGQKWPGSACCSPANNCLHPPLGMKLLKVPSSGCPWRAFLLLPRGGGLYLASEALSAILNPESPGCWGQWSGCWQRYPAVP